MIWYKYFIEGAIVRSGGSRMTSQVDFNDNIYVKNSNIISCLDD